MAKFFLLVMFIISTTLTGVVQADEEETLLGWLFNFSRQKEVKPVSNEAYKEECGSCHFAFQPGLLPSASWQKLFEPAALEDHFEENAELDEDVRKALLAYTLQNAAEKSYYKRSRKIVHATQGQDAPLRITEVSYIKRKHHEIPERLITGNEDVNSLSNCDTCHTQADNGNFDDDSVNIPNHGAWDD